MKKSLTKAITKGTLKRKDFLLWMIGISLSSSAMTTFLTLYKNIIPPKRSLEGKLQLSWEEVGQKNDFNEIPKMVYYGEEPIYVYMLEGKTVAFSSICPHVRCIVQWNTTGKPNPRNGEYTYDCPCHESSFDIYGRRLWGPAPRGLFEQKLKIENGRILLGGGTPG